MHSESTPLKVPLSPSRFHPLSSTHVIARFTIVSLTISSMTSTQVLATLCTSDWGLAGSDFLGWARPGCSVTVMEKRPQKQDQRYWRRERTGSSMRESSCSCSLCWLALALRTSCSIPSTCASTSRTRPSVFSATATARVAFSLASRASSLSSASRSPTRSTRFSTSACCSVASSAGIDSALSPTEIIPFTVPTSPLVFAANASPTTGACPGRTTRASPDPSPTGPR
mmetsp:Transcript_1359/g.2922  ORF Transcript_1359/g.2922 Transcript_1359/m.2922 type:complete len:227 (-) Transcript_1359:1428-2108(-)